MYFPKMIAPMEHIQRTWWGNGHKHGQICTKRIIWQGHVCLYVCMITSHI